VKKDKHIKIYTAAELRAKQVQSRTNWQQVDAMTDDDVENVIAADQGERNLQADWTKAKLILPQAKQSVHLRLETEIIAFFKEQGKGHISRMQAVLKAYVNAHKK
jgi:uncharacterized protein (DUF4415 family)